MTIVVQRNGDAVLREYDVQMRREPQRVAVVGLRGIELADTG